MSSQKTKFALGELKVEASGGVQFKFYFDGNGKVTLNNGTFDSPAPNAFSLVQIQDCPHATDSCRRDCYVNRLEKAEPEIHAKYQHNSVALRKILGNNLWFHEVALQFAEWIKRNCPHGFRWNISGDIISDKHALFIREVCRQAPSVPFWLYTRSFPLLGPILLPPLKNLVINLSADKDNYQEAVFLHQEHGLRICYMTVEGEVPDDLPDGSVIFPSHQLRGRDLPKPTEAPWWKSITKRQRKLVCPPDFFGQSEKLRCGPCKKCLVQVV